MSKFYYLLIGILLFFSTISIYALNDFWYSGTTFNNSGVLQPNLSGTLDVNITIKEGASQVYYEEHTGVSSDQFSHFSIKVGTGSNVVGTFGSINVTANTNIQLQTRTGAEAFTVVGGGFLFGENLKINGYTPLMTWNTTGNSGTDASSDFIGTTDAQDLVIKTVNAEKARITQNGRLILGDADNNVFMGGAGNETQTGYNNTSTGYGSLTSLTDGYFNTANGFEVLNSNTSGYYNTANGSESMHSNIDGFKNAANGSSSLYHNTSGSLNSAHGVSALYENTIGSQNTATGYRALSDNTVGSLNTATGIRAMWKNIDGYYNTATGSDALYTNTSGAQNVATGSGAMYYNETGFNNVANGFEALKSNTTGHSNTANGQNSLYSNISGHRNTANGTSSLYHNTIGAYNSALGVSALFENTEGNYNTASGYRALSENLTGDYNSAFGVWALYTNIGNANCAFGVEALKTNDIGDHNSAFGNAALFLNSTGINNTGIGSLSLAYNTTGNNNSGLGYNSGLNNTHNFVNYIGRIETNATQDEATLLTGDLFLVDPSTSGGTVTGTRIHFQGNSNAGINFNGTEMEAIDAANNVTVISPHKFELIKPSEDMAWSFYSKNDNQNKQINVDMLKAIRTIEQISGVKLVHVADMNGNEIVTDAKSKSVIDEIEKLKTENSELRQMLLELKNSIKNIKK